MPWDEWEDLKAEAVRNVGMQLNEAPPEGDVNESGDLSVSESELAKIGDDAFTLWGNVTRFGNLPCTATEKAASDLSKQNFRLGSALTHVHKRWTSQVKSLSDACAQISNHLDYTKHAHTGDEHYIGGQLSSISTLSRGFDNIEDRGAGK